MVQLPKVFNKNVKPPYCLGSQMLLFISYHHGIKTDIAKANKNNKNKAPCFSPSPCFRKNLPQISNKFFSWGISPHPHVQRDSGGAAFAHLSFQLRYKPKVSSVVQGQMSKEKLCSFGTSCVKPSSFLSFFFFLNSYFGFNTPKETALGNISSTQK